MEFIPNTPFPAKSLVKAIVSLILLGGVSDVSLQALPLSTHSSYFIQQIPQAKQEIYSFSNQTVVDITNLAIIFGDTGDGQLSQKTWEDLQATRWAI